ncbi:MAG: DUF2891 family protein [Planctomycetota bacterium]|jgi:hypothetical protein
MKDELLPIPERDAILEDLGAGILEAIRRRDTEHPVFHGCIDWHSSTHGHWALFRIARTLPAQRDGAEAADASLTPEGMQREARDLASAPPFEMPYGRAWFLRLASERERWCAETGAPDPLKLRPIADALAGSMLDFYAGGAPGPKTPEYANDAWALLQLHHWFRHTSDEGKLGAVMDHVRRGFLGEGPAITFAEDKERPEFFSRFGNWATLIAETQEPGVLADFLKSHPVRDEDLAPVEPKPGAAHHLGMNWSRAWALRALGDVLEGERERMVRAYTAHVRTAMKHHETHGQDYRAYGHWVPQFAIYALT